MIGVSNQMAAEGLKKDDTSTGRGVVVCDRVLFFGGWCWKSEIKIALEELELAS